MSEAIVETLREVCEEDARQLGELLCDLSQSHDGNPVPVDRLQRIIDSPNTDQFVARLHGKIVGAATLTLLGATLHNKVWLEDFVVSSDPSIRGQGVGYRLWGALETWASQRAASLAFCSSPKRTEAHSFYHRQGANIVPTSVFEKDLTNLA